MSIYQRHQAEKAKQTKAMGTILLALGITSAIFALLGTPPLSTGLIDAFPYLEQLLSLSPDERLGYYSLSGLMCILGCFLVGAAWQNKMSIR